MKTEEELRSLREEWESLRRKLAELSDEELEKVSGGFSPTGLDSRWKINGAVTSSDLKPIGYDGLNVR